jgi:tripartite-type tricarboxylate transporter receptor subunit TctC
MSGRSMSWFISLSLIMFMLAPGLGFAQDFPTKPIHLICMSAPGQIGDVTTRMLAGKAEKILGQPIEITNNNTAGGAVAFGVLGRAKPDGYTIASTASGLLIWTPFSRQVAYKLDDYAGVMVHMTLESGVVVKSDSPWKTFKELVAFGKQNPGKVSYAVTGAGNPMDLAMQYAGKLEGLRWTAVPVSGSDPNTMLLGGHVSAYSGSTSWLPHVKSGAFRLLAVHSGTRMKEFPDTPTFKELGYDFVHESDSMVLAPKGTPDPILKKLDDAFRQAMESKEFVDLVNKLGFKLTYIGYKELPKHLADQRDSVGKVVKALGVTAVPEKK